MISIGFQSSLFRPLLGSIGPEHRALGGIKPGTLLFPSQFPDQNVFTFPSPPYHQAILTAMVNAADGTPVFWATTNGGISDQTMVLNGQATAYLSPANGRVGPVLVSAAVAGNVLIWEGRFVSSAPLVVEPEHPLLVSDRSEDGTFTIQRLTDKLSYEMPYYTSTKVHVTGPPNAVAMVSFGIDQENLSAYTFDSMQGNTIPDQFRQNHLQSQGATLSSSDPHLGLASLHFSGEQSAQIADAAGEKVFQIGQIRD